MCAADFSSAVSHVLGEESPNLLRRMLSYLKDKKPSVSNSDCIKLFQAIDTIETTEEGKLAAFRTIVYALSRNGTALPSTELTDTLISFSKRFGWNCTANPIKAYVAKLRNRKELNIDSFIRVADLILKIQQASDSNGFELDLNEAIKDFESQKGNQTPSSGYYSYRSQYNSSSTQATATALVAFCQSHPREKTMPVIDASISRLRGENCTNVNKLNEVASLLQRLRAFQDSKNIERWFHSVVEDFISIVEKLPSTSSSSTRYSYGGSSGDALSGNNAEELFRRLLEFGGSNDIKRVQQWAMTAQLGQLSKLESTLNRVLSGTSNTPTSPDAAAASAFVQAVKGRIKTLKLCDLYARHQKLLSATQGRQPVFSWSMPQANTSSPALTAFLRSPRSGPETIIVGGGIGNARFLAGGGSRYGYSRYSSNSNRSDPLQQGYSATIEATRATGRSAAIRVTKTRALHEARMKKYTNDLAELTKTTDEIRKLGGSVSSVSAAPAAAGATLPGRSASASAAQAVIDLDSTCQPNPAKKRRVKAPIPSDAEIVEIE